MAEEVSRKYRCIAVIRCATSGSIPLLENQRSLIVTFVKRHGWTLIDQIILDGVGHGLDRRTVELLVERKRVVDDFDAVVVADPSRIARDVEMASNIYSRFRKASINVICANGGFCGSDWAGLYEAMADYAYRSDTDTVINVLHGIVGKVCANFPLDEIRTYLAGRGATVDLEKTQLLDNRLRFILLNLIYVERFGTSPFNVKFKGNEPHVDHIYPQSALRSKLGFAGSDINHLGNYRFVGATDNIRKRAQMPDSYFSGLKTAGVPILNHLLVKDYADDPAKLKFTGPDYTTFRDRRLQECWEIAKAVVNP